MALFLLDSGAYTLKSGFSDSSPSLHYNCIGKSKRSSVLTYTPTTLRGFHEVCRPVERGVVVDPQLQCKIWSKVLKTVSAQDTSLLMTVPMYTPKTVLRWIDEIVFEQFGFAKFARRPTAVPGTLLLIDIGFSGSTVTPIIDSCPINYATKRTSVGGKVITNFLKREISFRYYDVTDETWLVSDIKEKAGRVSADFISELRKYQCGEIAKVNYVLPDSSTEDGRIAFPGEDLSSKQVLSLDNLCISPSELLFTPSDIGLSEGGLQHAVMEAVSRLDASFQSELLGNILVTGGSSLFPGLETRLLKELTSLSPCSQPPHLTLVPNPIAYSWSHLSSLSPRLITKSEYEDLGSDYLDTIAA